MLCIIETNIITLKTTILRDTKVEQARVESVCIRASLMCLVSQLKDQNITTEKFNSIGGGIEFLDKTLKQKEKVVRARQIQTQ